jgi:Zn-dependent peptidase ImmA (M78 family)/DNA-binding XRE family transcriptional regulator
MSAIADGFVGERLTEARLARGLSGVALADILGISTTSVSKYENGRQSPKLDALHQMATALRFPLAYFLRPIPTGDDKPIFWRGKLSAPPSAKDRAYARLAWAKEMVDYLGSYFNFHPLNVPDFAVRDIEALTDDDLQHFAEQIREHWDIRPGPMPDVIEKLELNGILVSRISVQADKLDAFSQWSDRFGVPFMVLGRDKASAVRQRYDALHELAHLAAHRHIPAKRLNDRAFYNLVERQADRIAAHLLLPEKEFVTEVFSPSLDALLTLKERWGASVGAMIMRCKSLGILDEDSARVMWINYNRRGWRKSEPLDSRLVKERPEVIRRCFERLIESKKQTPSDILAALPFPASDLEEIADLEPGTLTGGVPGRGDLSFKDDVEETNVVKIFQNRNRR